MVPGLSEFLRVLCIPSLPFPQASTVISEQEPGLSEVSVLFYRLRGSLGNKVHVRRERLKSCNEVKKRKRGKMSHKPVAETVSRVSLLPES